jgi:hypothetical protein
MTTSTSHSQRIERRQGQLIMSGIFIQASNVQIFSHSTFDVPALFAAIRVITFSI